MENQLRDQWDAMMDAAKSGDMSLKARLMVQTAKVLMEEAASLGMPKAQPDQAGKRLLAQWFQVAKTVADNLGPAVAALDQSLEGFKADADKLLVHLTQISEQLQSKRAEYERVAVEHQSLRQQADELRKKEATLEPLLTSYRELKALDDRVKTALPKLADDQEALIALWPALGEACKQLQAQRELLVVQINATGTIAESLGYENKLFGRAPGLALEQAILAVADARDAVDRLVKHLYSARQEQQGQVQESMLRLLER